MPVVGSLPDMTSFTDLYIDLKIIYQDKAKEDRDVIFKYIKEILDGIKDSSLEIKKEYLLTNLTNEFDLPYIICKNWSCLSIANYNTISKELATPDFTSVGWWDPSTLEAFYWYLISRASNLFYNKHKRHPGQVDDHEKVINIMTNY